MTIHIFTFHFGYSSKNQVICIEINPNIMLPKFKRILLKLSGEALLGAPV